MAERITTAPERNASGGSLRSSANTTALNNLEPSSESGGADAQSSTSSEHIARTAYYCAERRGFAPGHELDDWLEAERDLAAEGGETLKSPR
jgi:hypothetical protein